MQNSTSNSEAYQLGDGERFVRSMYKTLIDRAHEQKQIDDSMRMFFLSLPIETTDELEDAYVELQNALDNAKRYKLISRIEKADEVIASEPDPDKREYYRKKQKELMEELERMIAA